MKLKFSVSEEEVFKLTLIPVRIMVRICLLFAGIFLGLFQICVAQNHLEGKVLDVEKNGPISYVNIGIPKQFTGTVSGRDGSYRLAYRSESDSVLFSAIGYQSFKTSVEDLLKNRTVFLERTVYELEEILVSDKALGPLTDLGYNLRKRGQSIGFGSTQLGTEIGGLIKIDRETFIYGAHFTLNNTGNDSFLFRVNLYEFESGEPTKNLVPENVFISSPHQPGTLSVDLSSYNIVTGKDVLVSLEWIEAVSIGENEIQAITFRTDRTRRDANVYFKSTSHAPFVKFDQFVKYNLGFYVTARQVTP